MEMSVKVIVWLTLVIILLVVLTFFIAGQSGVQISQSTANQVFSTKCQDYKTKDCSWSVTEEEDFNSFVDACRSLYGDKYGAYSCLYVFCPACSKISPDKSNIGDELRCASKCSECEGNTQINARSTCCQQFASQCTATGVDCSGVCP